MLRQKQKRPNPPRPGRVWQERELPGPDDVVTVRVSDDGGDWEEVLYSNGRKWRDGIWMDTGGPLDTGAIPARTGNG